jgi:PQQ-dependent dehydrogenase (s-GDH family)
MLQKPTPMRKKILFYCLFVFLINSAYSQNETFTVRTINDGSKSRNNYRLNSAWELTYGPDDSLWVTESNAYLVSKINIANGGKTQLLDLSSQRGFSGSQDPWPQGGLMGMALHPSMYSEWPNPSKPWVYLAYVYQFVGYFKTKSGKADSGAFFKTRIVRYDYQRSTHQLINPETIIETLNGSSDHNSGRLTIGNIGGAPYLFYTIGDMGTGQFKNLNRTNRAQLRDTLEGKVLRFNLDAIGSASDPQNWIPDDNPFQDANGNATAVWSYGHRNAQGLAFGSNGILYSSEQQDMSDDEVNIIEKGRDYGWPLVSGYSDGNYDGWTLANMHVTSEAQDSIDYNLRAPVYTLYTTANPGTLYGTSNSTWPTVACSSLEVYENYTILDWNRSLLVPSLKAGQVFKLKLSGDGKSVTDMQTITAMNLYNKARLRDICVSPDGTKIYVSCDMSSQNSSYQGRILEYTYKGPLGVLSITHDSINRPAFNTKIEVYPNPASNMLFVKSIKNQSSPLHYSIFDINGKLVLKGNSNINNFGINIQTLSPGVYVFKLYNAYFINIYSTKVVVN